MAKIIFVNRFFYPDQSATSQLLTDLASSLAADGHEIHVIASRNRITGQSGQQDRDDAIPLVTIHRVGRNVAQSARLLSRLIAFLQFYTQGAFQLRRNATGNSIIVNLTDPPLLSVWAYWLLLGRSVHLVNWLQDIYPEIAIRLELRIVRGFVGDFLTRLRDQSLRKASANVVLGNQMARYIEARGIANSSIRVIPNWVDDDAIRPVAPEANPLRRDWGLTEKFVIAYSGNLGRVHEFDTVVAAAQRLRHRQDLRFLFIGGGFQYSALMAAFRQRGLEDLAMFRPYQDQSELANSLTVADAHWLSLRPAFEALIVPSKFYGIIAAGRPVIAIVDPNGEIARLVGAFNCGSVVAPGDGAALAKLLELMMTNRSLGAQWGRNARTIIDTHFSRKHAIAKWRDLIRSLVADPSEEIERAYRPEKG
jgi:glycosyltransferase involved in cell wall biosynthesis